MIKAKGIEFYNEKGTKITICPPLKGKPINVQSLFEPPFIIIDTYKSKTTKPEEIVNVEIDELKKLGFIICVLKASGQFRPGQRVIYRLASVSNPIFNSKIIGYIPKFHTIQKDVNNHKIRLQGRNAGKFGYSKWTNISESTGESKSITPTKRRGFGRYL